MLSSRGRVPYFARAASSQGFPSVYFVNTNLPEERSKILRTEEELKNIPDNSTNIFKRNIPDQYMD